MSTSSSFSVTSVNSYSQALYELANENNSLDLIEQQVVAVIKLISQSEDFNTLIKDPTNSQKDQLLVLSKISQKYNLNNLLIKFLSFLISKRRFFYLEKILNNFVNTCSIKRGEVKASLVSSRNLSQDELNDISADFSKSMGSTIKFDYSVDESLIGGLKIQLGSFMIDTSIKNKLKKYKQLVIEN